MEALTKYGHKIDTPRETATIRRFRRPIGNNFRVIEWRGTIPGGVGGYVGGAIHGGVCAPVCGSEVIE